MAVLDTTPQGAIETGMPESSLLLGRTAPAHEKFDGTDEKHSEPTIPQEDGGQNNNSQAPISMNHMEQSMFNHTTWPEASHVPHTFNYINSVMFFKRLPSEDKFKALAKDSMCKFWRFKSIACDDGSWTPVPLDEMDFSYHVSSEAPIPEADLSSTIDRMASEELDSKRPLWRIRLLPVRLHSETLEAATLQAAVLQIHHSIGDGFHLNKVFGEVSTRADGSKPDVSQQKFAGPEPRRRDRFCWGHWPLATQQSSYPHLSPTHLPLRRNSQSPSGTFRQKLGKRVRSALARGSVCSYLPSPWTLCSNVGKLPAYP
jgi:hypothetical protein